MACNCPSQVCGSHVAAVAARGLWNDKIAHLISFTRADLLRVRSLPGHTDPSFSLSFPLNNNTTSHSIPTILHTERRLLFNGIISKFN